MPTIYREGPFRLFFNSREESRVHVHVEAPDGIATFWLEPLVSLAVCHGLNTSDLTRIEGIVLEHRDEFIAAWRKHLG